MSLSERVTDWLTEGGLRPTRSASSALVTVNLWNLCKETHTCTHNHAHSDIRTVFSQGTLHGALMGFQIWTSASLLSARVSQLLSSQEHSQADGNPRDTSDHMSSHGVAHRSP